MNRGPYKRGYQGVTYPDFLAHEFVWRLWKKYACPRGWHLFDEVLGRAHYLSCDACGMEVSIMGARVGYKDG